MMAVPQRGCGCAQSMQIDGPKYGPLPFYSTKSRCCLPVKHKDPRTGLEFMFMYKVCFRNHDPDHTLEHADVGIDRSNENVHTVF